MPKSAQIVAGHGLEDPTSAVDEAEIGGTSATHDTHREIQAAISTVRSTKTQAYCRSVAELGLQVAEALDYAHAEGVVHRDIKPSNLIADGKGDVWITDFGLARIASEPGLTMTGDMLGTLRYMSPEQALAKRGLVDHRTDVYSLGVTLYELLALRPAFPGRDREEVLRQIAFEEPRPPHRFNKRIPTELETVVLKAMAKNPAERYGTAAELAEDLCCFLEDRPIHARRPTILQRTAKWTRRHKGVVAAAAVLLVLTTIGLAVSNVLIAEQRNKAVEAGGRLRVANREVTDARDRIARLLASSYVSKAQTLSESGQIAAGMLWLAHAHAVAPESAVELRRAIRASLASWRPRLNVLQAVFEDDHGVRAAAISPDGKWVVTGSKKGRIRLWDSATGELRAERQGHVHNENLLGGDPRVNTISFSPDGSRILSSAKDTTARLWDAQTLEPIGDPLIHPETEPFGNVWRAIFSPDGKYVATCGRKTVQLWDAGTGTVLGEPLRHPSGRVVRAIAFSPDGSRLVSGAEDQYAIVWDLSTRKAVSDPLPASGQVYAVAYSGDGSRILTTDSSGALQYWDAATFALQGSPLYHGARVAAADYRSVKVWDAKTLSLIGDPLPHPLHVRAVAISRDGEQVDLPTAVVSLHRPLLTFPSWSHLGRLTAPQSSLPRRGGADREPSQSADCGGKR